MQVNQPSIAQLEQAAASGNETARLELGQRLLTQNPPGSDGCERGLELLRQAATRGSQAPAARWLLGNFYLKNLALPDNIAQACYWMELAARSGVGPALDRMANLYLHGVGVKFRPERALALLKRLAGAGFKRAAWEIGYLKSTLDELEDPCGAVAAFARACALSYPPAFYSLGLRFAVGAGVKADPGFARALLLYAADAGVRDAREAADELVPADGYGPDAEHWYAELKRNLAAAGPLVQQLRGGGMTIPEQRLSVVDNLESHFASINHPAITISETGRLILREAHGEVFRARPGEWSWLCERPRVATSTDFLTREERAQILSMVSSAMVAPEKYIGSDAHGLVENRFFNGTGMYFNEMTSDAMVRCIERRIAAHTGWQLEAIEASSVICYKPGQEYRPHVDYFIERQIEENRAQRDFGGQRVVTFMICLQAAEAGGETYYPHANLKVAHHVGSATMHYNTTPDGWPDEFSLHHGMSVERGEKWLLRTTLRAGSQYREGV